MGAGLRVNIYMLLESLKILSDPGVNLWNECLDVIQNRCFQDPLFKNYLNLDPSKYFYFSTIVYENKIISFGAIEYSPKKWGDEIARVLTRFWIHPDYRSNGLTKWGDHSIRFSPLILRSQLNFLKDHNKIKVAMITREGKYKKSFEEISRLATQVAEDSFEIADEVYNVCGDSEDLSCYQMVSLSSLYSDIDKWKIFQRAKQQGHFKKYQK